MKKIYQELVAIRKELQEIKEILKPTCADILIGGETVFQAEDLPVEPTEQ